MSKGPSFIGFSQQSKVERLQTENEKLKDILDNICGITYDHDGYTTIEGLKKLIDDMHDYASKAFKDG